MRTATSGTAFVLLAALAAGCSEEPPAPVRTADNGDRITTADVTFAQEMMRCQAETLVLVDLTVARPLAPALADVAEDLLASGVDQSDQLQTWLTDWGEEVPETARDHAHAHDEAGEGHDDLASAQGAVFEREWARAMIEQVGACRDLARDHARDEDAHFAPGRELAQALADSHDDAISTLEDHR